jgi:hypothetical protein
MIITTSPDKTEAIEPWSITRHTITRFTPGLDVKLLVDPLGHYEERMNQTDRDQYTPAPTLLNVYRTLYREPLATFQDFQNEHAQRLMATAIESQALLDTRIILPQIPIQGESLYLYVDFMRGIYEGSLEMIFKARRPEFLNRGVFARPDTAGETLAERIGPEQYLWTVRVTPDSGLTDSLRRANGLDTAAAKALVGTTQRTVSRTGSSSVRWLEHKSSRTGSSSVRWLEHKSAFPRLDDVREIKKSGLEGPRRLEYIFELFHKYQSYKDRGEILYPGSDRYSQYLYWCLPSDYLIRRIETALKSPMEVVATVAAIQILQHLGFKEINAGTAEGNSHIKKHREQGDNLESFDYNALIASFFDYQPQSNTDPFPFKLQHSGRKLGLPDRSKGHITPELWGFLLANQ